MKTKVNIRTKILVKHSADCYSVEEVRAGRGYSPWSPTDEVLYRDRRGGRTGRACRWNKWRCNCTHCPALILVNSNDVERALTILDGVDYHCQQSPSPIPPPKEEGAA